MSRIDIPLEPSGFVLWPIHVLPRHPDQLPDVFNIYRKAWDEAQAVTRLPITDRLLANTCN